LLLLCYSGCKITGILVLLRIELNLYMMIGPYDAHPARYQHIHLWGKTPCLLTHTYVKASGNIISSFRQLLIVAFLNHVISQRAYWLYLYLYRISSFDKRVATRCSGRNNITR
jgi:hypothetical protein